MSESHTHLKSSGLSFWPLMASAFVLIVVWGTAFTMISVGVRYMSPMWLVAIRCIIGAVLVTAYVLIRGERLPKLSDVRWLWYSGLGFIGVVFPFILTATGQVKVDSGISAILVGAMPIITIILAHFFASEPLTWRKFIGFVIGFVGIVILFLPKKLGFTLIENWQYQLLLIGAAFCYAITTVTAKRAPDTPSSVGAAIMLLAAALFSVTIGLSFEGVPEMPIAPLGLMMVVGLGVGSTAVGTILYLYVIEQNGPSVLAKINYFPPLAAVITGVWLLGEPFTYRIAIAFCVILIGVLIARTK